MSIIRTDEQADGLEILKLIKETADFYKAMADLLEEKSATNKLNDIAKEREMYLEPFRQLVKKLHELPAQPDPEKELVEEWGGKITKLLASDSKSALLDKCIKKDDELAELVNDTVLRQQSSDVKSLLDSLSNNLANTKQALLVLKD